MKVASIILFVLAALAAIRPLIAIPFGIFLMMTDPNSGIHFDVFLPRAVGMLLLPMIFLIVGLTLWKKAKAKTAHRSIP